MCELCQGDDDKATLTGAACALTEINSRIALAQANLLEVAADIRQSGAGEAQIEAALKILEDLQVEALRASQTVDGASETLRLGSQFGELDALTALPNRHLLMDRLNHGIAAAKRSDRKLAVLFIDLDDFKSINDLHGHAVGDSVLQHVAHCLLAAVRQADTVSRIGGDEFVVLLTEIGDTADAAVAAEKILTLLRERCAFGDGVFHLAASIGMSVYPVDGTVALDLIARADEAMYRAKRMGFGSFSF